MKTKEQKPLVIEVKDVNDVNALEGQGYRLERYSESRDCYILVRRLR